MAITKIEIVNLLTTTLVVDEKIDERRALRKSIPAGGKARVDDIATLDELNRNAQLTAWRTGASPKIRIDVTEGSDDLPGTGPGSGMDAAPLNSKGIGDVFPIVKDLIAGAGGAAADATIFAADAPFALAILDEKFHVMIEGGAGSTARLNAEAGGAGADLGSALDIASVGIKSNTDQILAGTTIAKGGSLYFRVTDNAVRGRLVLLATRVS